MSNHTAPACFHRFNVSFQASTAPQANVTNVQSPTGLLPTPTNMSEPQGASSLLSSSSDPHWFFDSGATHHITNDEQYVHNPTSYVGSDSVSVGSGSQLPIQSTGNGILPLPSSSLFLNNVLYVPHMSHKLLSVYQLAANNNCSLLFDAKGVQIRDNNTSQLLYSGPCRNGMYPFHRSSSPLSPQAMSSSKVSSDLWNRRLGHPHKLLLQKTLSKYELPVSSFNFHDCHNCLATKTHKLPFSLSMSHTRAPLELVHSDVWGPSPLDSISGFKYYLIFIDDFTRFCWLFPLRSKSEVFHCFVNYHKHVE